MASRWQHSGPLRGGGRGYNDPGAHGIWGVHEGAHGLQEGPIKISVKTFFLRSRHNLDKTAVHKTGNPSYLRWLQAHVRLSAPLATLYSIWPALDLNLRPSAPETNALPLEQLAGFENRNFTKSKECSVRRNVLNWTEWLKKLFVRLEMTKKSTKYLPGCWYIFLTLKKLLFSALNNTPKYNLTSSSSSL